jgi:hypothetical protein
LVGFCLLHYDPLSGDKADLLIKFFKIYLTESKLLPLNTY